MRYPTPEQRDGARSQKASDFGLTPRALKFARLYAENPDRTISDAARAAGYSDRATTLQTEDAPAACDK